MARLMDLVQEIGHTLKTVSEDLHQLKGEIRAVDLELSLISDQNKTVTSYVRAIEGGSIKQIKCTLAHMVRVLKRS